MHIKRNESDFFVWTYNFAKGRHACSYYRIEVPFTQMAAQGLAQIYENTDDVPSEKATAQRKRGEPVAADAKSTPTESTESTESDEVSEDEEEEGEDWQPTQKEAIEAALADLRALPALKRYRVILAASFVVFYLGMMLLRGLHENHIKPVLPYVVWYFDGLGLARTWGMFAHPSTELPVFVYGVTNDEKEFYFYVDAADRAEDLA